MKLKGLVIWIVGFFLIFSAAGCAGNLQENSHFHVTSPINTSYKDGTQVNQERKDILETKSQFTQELKNTDWWTGVQKNIQEQEYYVTYQDRTNLPGVASAYQAPNRAQNLRTFFTSDGITIVRRTESIPSWNMGLTLDAVGRQEKVFDLPPYKVPKLSGPRVEYFRGPVLEWYENRPEGLEQGFTIPEKLEGRSPLFLILHFRGDLKPEIAGDNRSIDLFTSSYARVLSYGDLEVIDATGKKLPCHLELENNFLKIVVDDSQATYPILIDPLIISPPHTQESNQSYAHFGRSVSTAGDINGDGYSDIIVGAPDYDAGQYGEGRAFVFFGSASGISTVASWTAESNQGDARFGGSVNTAGDVNGDGYSDIIIGAYGWSKYNLWLEDMDGAVFIYHGSKTGLGENGTPQNADLMIESTPYYAQFGYSVSTAGDVDRDGYSDVIVGALYEGNGKVFVYYGSVSGITTASPWTVESDQSGALYGSAVGAAGDVNGDGYDDIIIGAPDYTNGQTDEGRVLVYYGSASGVSNSSPWIWESNITGIKLGASVGTAGDVNGDGYSDIIVGAPDYSLDQTKEGLVFVCHGSASGLNSWNWWAQGKAANARFGTSVGTLGDVNGDGYADIIVGAPYYTNGQTDEGGAFLYRGSASGLSLNGDRASGTPLNADWSSEGNQASARFGASVSAAGDVDGDGFSDFLVGAPFYTNGHTNEGRAYIYYGAALVFSEAADGSVENGQQDAVFGTSVSTAGDVNGDGFSDIIIGAPDYDNGQADEGRVYLYYGSTSGVSSASPWIAESNQAGAHYGSSVSSAGDVNGDGFADVIIGAPNYTSGQSEEGRVYVYYGSAAGVNSSSPWIGESNQAGTHYGSSVSSAGDVNGDGFADVIIGAPNYTNGQSQEGRTYVYYGSATGVNSASPWFREGNQAGAHYGSSVSSAGDVNGDGFFDIIIGVPDYTNGQSQEGGAFVYLGSGSGLKTSSQWIGESNQANAHYGKEVGLAGDVNGDGFSDVIIGAPGYDTSALGGSNGGGRVYVYHGSASGLSSTEDWTDWGTGYWDQFGTSVDTAGDVNGDGYSDIIIGGLFFSDVHPTGGALVYYGAFGGLELTEAWSVFGTLRFSGFGSSVGTAGDVNGDGFSDIIVAEPWPAYNDDTVNAGGRAFAYYGNEGSGKISKIKQLKTNGTDLISQNGSSDSETSFNISVIGTAPMGRSDVQMEWEVKESGVPFDGMTTFLSPWQDTGNAGYLFNQTVTGLTGHQAYHWRVRFRYPPGNPAGQVASRWMSPFPGSPLHLRTNNNPPIAGYHQITQEGDGSGVIIIYFRLQDAGLNFCTLHTFQYSVDGGSTWKTPIGGDASGSLGGGWPDDNGSLYSSSTDWSGTIHSFSFNTKYSGVAADFNGQDQNDVRVRITVNDGQADSITPVITNNFRVDDLPPLQGSITINDDNGSTNDTTPDLTISASGAAYMRIALSEGALSSATWIAYATSYSAFNISPGGNGSKTVWVEFKDEFGNIQMNHASDTTVYDTSPNVTGDAKTNDTSPTWCWESVSGGSGLFRYKLDSSDLSTGATETTDTCYTPVSVLTEGFHTLYIQEWNVTGYWSWSGSFVSEIDTGKPCSEANSPTAVDDLSKTFTIFYTYDDIYAGETCGSAFSGSGLNSVALYVRAPGESSYSLTDTDPNGAIDGEFEYTATDQGVYRFYSRAIDKAGNVENIPVSRYDTETIYASQFAGYAILAVGAIAGQEGLESHTLTANNVYRHLIHRNFALVDDAVEKWNDPLDHIKYFNPFSVIQTGEDDYSEGGTISYWTAVQKAITQWALAKMQVLAGPLYIILIDHGTPDKFYLNSPAYFTSGELDSWLDILETGLAAEGINEEIILILGTCYSGSFFNDLSESGKSRIIVASTAADEPSYRGPLEPGGVRDGEFFISALFNELGSGYDLKTGFRRAVERTKIHTDSGYINAGVPYFDTAMQHPLLDDNGDGIGSHDLSSASDGDVASNLYLGKGTDTPQPVVITAAGQDPAVPLGVSDHQALLWAKVSAIGRTQKVWAEVRDPGTTLDGGSDQQVVGLIAVPLNLNGDRYEVSYNDFWLSGTYKVFFYARDTSGLISPFKTAFVYKRKNGNDPPQTFNLLSPTDGTVTTERSGLGAAWAISVDPDTDPVTYLLEIWQDPTDSRWGGQAFYFKREGIVPTYTVVADEANFVDLRTYRWQVTAVDQYGAERASNQVWTFEVDNTNPLSGWLHGIVYDVQDDQLIDIAQVSAAGLGIVMTGDGSYLGSGPPGNYTLTVTAAGYAQRLISAVGVSEGDAAKMDIGLTPMLDSDGDGIPDTVENAVACLDANDDDSDDDGILDGSEDADHDGVVDVGETDPCKADTDNDGLLDGIEIGLTAPQGSDTDLGVFIADVDPSTTTDPLDDDTDGDGRLDGAEDKNHNGRVDPGEKDPNKFNARALPHIPLLLLDGH